MEHRIELKNEMSELEKIQRFMERLSRALCLSQKNFVETNLALEEVFANIVAYAYEDRQEGVISISVISPVNGALVLRIEDNGKPFNPLEAAKPEPAYDLENCRIGGLGIHLVKKLMDRVNYDYRDYKNVFEMKKAVTPNCGQAHHI